MASSPSPASTTPSARGRHTKRAAMLQMPGVLATSFLFMSCCFTLFIDLEGSFLRTTVHCEVPQMAADGSCPDGSYPEAGECVAEAPGSGRWSYSEHCARTGVVLQQGAKMYGKLGMAEKMGQLFANVYVGPLLDCYGRKPAILLGIATATIRCLLFFAATHFTDYVVQLVFPGVLIASVTNCMEAATRAMVADLHPSGDAEATGVAFAALALVNHLAVAVGFAAGYLILYRELSDYGAVWLGCAAVAALLFLFAFFVLRETLSRRGRADGPCKGVSKLGCLPMLGIVSGQYFLKRFMIISLLSNLSHGCLAGTVRVFMISYLGKTQAMASLIGVIVPAQEALGAALAPCGASLVGPRRLFATGLACGAVGLFIVGLGGPMPEAAEVCFWFGFTFFGLGAGLEHAIGPSLICGCVPQTDQGALFAFYSMVELVGKGLGVYIGTNHLYDSGAAGWSAGSVFFMAALVQAVSAVWFIYAARSRVSSPPPDDAGSEGDNCLEASSSEQDGL